jgi:hypothetical protein
MAKSIFETLDSLTTETSVPVVGKNVEHTLPRTIFPTSEQFESAEKLLAWSNENGYTHALLQAGIQKGLIDVRATFKACKKDDTWTANYGQVNVDKMTWTVTERPKAGNKVENAIDTLSKLSPEQLAEIIAKIQAEQFKHPKLLIS